MRSGRISFISIRWYHNSYTNNCRISIPQNLDAFDVIRAETRMKDTGIGFERLDHRTASRHDHATIVADDHLLSLLT